MGFTYLSVMRDSVFDNYFIIVKKSYLKFKSANITNTRALVNRIEIRFHQG